MNLSNVKQWIADGNIAAVENLWMDAIEEPATAEHLKELAELLASERFTFQSTSARHGPEICTQHAKARKSVSRSTDPPRIMAPPFPSEPGQHVAQVNLLFNLCVVL